MFYDIFQERPDRGGWSNNSLQLLEEVKCALEAMRDYWPLTLRQLYYQLVAKGIIENNQSQYQRLSRLLVKARLDDLVSWKAIEDRSRVHLNSTTFQDATSFIQHEKSAILQGYKRDLLKTQDIVPEIWIEKDALSRICHGVADNYCIPVIVTRGFSSLSCLGDARNRILGNMKNDRMTLILYFGDLDPSGYEMLPSILKTLRYEMDLDDNVAGIRCALTPEQVAEFNLPKNPAAIKEKDTRARKYVEQFGDLAIELDALPPHTFEDLVQDSIEKYIEMDLFEIEYEKEKEDEEYINNLREKVIEVVDK